MNPTLTPGTPHSRAPGRHALERKRWQPVQSLLATFAAIPHSLIALLARFCLAAVFWKSGQTKIEGLAIDLVGGEFTLGWPHLADSAVALFRDEYKLPLLPPAFAATLAAVGEHVLPVFLLLGLGTRLAAFGLLGMTAVIQLFVFPGAYATHGVWAAGLLWLMALGPGRVSIDAWIDKCMQGHAHRD